MQIQAHMCILASKSPVLAKMMLENKINQTRNQTNKDYKKIVIDFQGEVLYQAFKKIVDYCYLEDINILGQINNSNEMIEVIKLANQFGFTSMIRATENFFTDNMLQLLDSNSTFLSINYK